MLASMSPGRRAAADITTRRTVVLPATKIVSNTQVSVVDLRRFELCAAINVF